MDNIVLTCAGDPRSTITFRSDFSRNDYSDYLVALGKNDPAALMEAYRKVVVALNIIVGKRVIDGIDELMALDVADLPLYLEHFIVNAYGEAVEQAKRLGKPTLPASKGT